MSFDPSAVRSGANASSNPFYQGAWVCYINGVETPIVGFEVDASVWQIPTFRLHLVPDPLLQRLGHEDRVPVALFYLDQWYDPEHPEFRLLIDGEIVDYGFSETSGGRVVTLTCQSFINVFQQIYFSYLTSIDDVIAARDPSMVAQSLGNEAGLIYPYALFHQGLLTLPAQVNEASPIRRGSVTTTNTEGTGASAPIQTAYELVYNVIKGCISSTLPADRRAVPMMNFFARHIRKTRLHQRFVRLPLLEDPERIKDQEGVFPIFRAVRNAEALNAMQRHVAGQVGNAGPVWNLLQQLLGLVYMEIGMTPNPCVVQVALQDMSGGSNGNPTEGRILGTLLENAAMVDQTPPAVQGQPAPTPSGTGSSPLTPTRLAQYFVKPQLYFSCAPACNVFFPSQIDSWSYNEDYRQATRVYVNDSVITQALRADAGPNRELMLHALTVGWPEEADALMHHKVGSTGQGMQAAHGPTESGKNLLIWPTEYYLGPITERASLPAWFQMLRQFQNAATTQRTPPSGPPPAQPQPAPLPGTPPSEFTPQGQRVIPNGPNRPHFALGATSRGAQVVLVAYRSDGRWVTIRPDQADRVTLRAGTGLDPANYVPAHYRALWPFRIEPGRRARRGQPARRRRVVNEGTPAQRSGQLIRRLLPHIRTAYPELTDVQQQGLAVAHTMLIHTETGSGVTFGWNFVNHRQFTGNRPGRWTCNPGDGFTYTAADSADDALAAYVRVMKDRFGGAVEAAVQGRSNDAQVVAASRNRVPRNSAWQLFDGVRPDLFMLTLGRIRYSSTATVAAYARNVYGGTGDQVLAGWRLLQAGAVPPDVETTVEIREQPLASPEDLAMARRGGSPTRAQVVQVTRPPAPTSPQAPQPGTQQGTPPNTTPPPQTAPAPTQARVSTEEAAQTGNEFARLFRLYAQYEFLRGRYQKRQAGAQLRFNPYVVLGFPGFLFGSSAAQHHIVGYVQGFRHSGSVEGGASRLDSQVQMSFCRTFAEFVNDVRADVLRFEGRVTAAPAEIVSEIREITQDEHNAEAFYSKLLHGGRPHRYNGQEIGAAFRWTEAMGYTEGLQTAEITITGDSVELQERRAREEAANANTEDGESPPASTLPPSAAVSARLDPNYEFSPRDNVYQDAFANYHTAMRLAARPACTLNEYIRFWHGGRTVEAMQASGDVGPEKRDFAYSKDRDTTERTTAVYYDRIYKLRPGPGTGADRLTGPTPEERGYTDPPDILPTETTRGVDANYPQTRADWDNALELYRHKVRNIKRPDR